MYERSESSANVRFADASNRSSISSISSLFPYLEPLNLAGKLSLVVGDNGTNDVVNSTFEEFARLQIDASRSLNNAYRREKVRKRKESVSCAYVYSHIAGEISSTATGDDVTNW